MTIVGIFNIWIRQVNQNFEQKNVCIELKGMKPGILSLSLSFSIEMRSLHGVLLRLHSTLSYFCGRQGKFFTSLNTKQTLNNTQTIPSI